MCRHVSRWPALAEKFFGATAVPVKSRPHSGFRNAVEYTGISDMAEQDPIPSSA